MSLWPALPVELKRLILELVALDDINDARSLRFVSRDINVLVLPIVFNNIIIENIDDVVSVTLTILPPPAIHHKLRSRKPDPPRVLSTYSTTSLALLLPDSLPSIENALAGVGSAFSRLRYLAITSRNLSSNAFWLRDNYVRPTHLMLLHHGSPRPVNWRDTILRQVTHLFTSSLDSHGRSTLSDLHNLTHVAVQTHTELSEDTICYIADKLEWLLDVTVFPNLQALVLALDRFPKPPQHCKFTISYPQDTAARERYLILLSRWRINLQFCLSSCKFYILPDPRCPQTEWENWVHRDSQDIWCRARSYREKYPNSIVLDPREPEIRQDLDQWLTLIQVDLLQFDVSPPSSSVSDTKSYRKRRYPKIDWEIDLVQRDGYRETDRLDPEEAGEYEHVLGGF